MPDVLGTPGGTSPNQVGQFYVPPSEWNPAPLDEDLSSPVVFNAALTVSLFLTAGFLAPWAGSNDEPLPVAPYEEDSWVPPVLSNSTSVSLLIGGVNQSTLAPYIIDEEYPYNLPIIWPSQVIRLTWGGDEESSALTSTDGDEWQPKLPQSDTLGKLTLWPTDDITSTAAAAIPFDEPWVNLNSIRAPWAANPSLDSNGDWVPFVPGVAEEDFWLPVSAAIDRTFSLIVGTSAKVEAIGPASSIVEDENAYPNVPQEPPLLYLISPWEFGVSDEITPLFTEDYWQNPVAPVRLTYDPRFVVRDTGESVPGVRPTEDEVFRPAVLLPQTYRNIHLWNRLDQTETFIGIKFDEELWVAKQLIWPASTIVTPWRAGENEFLTTPFGIDDDSWAPHSPPQATLIGQSQWLVEQGDAALIPPAIIDEEYSLSYPITVAKFALVWPYVFEQHEIFTPVPPPLVEPKCATEIVTLGAFTIEGPSTVAITLEISLTITPSVESPTDPCL